MATHGQTRRAFLRRAAGVAVSGAGALRQAQAQGGPFAAQRFGQAPAIVTAARARPSSTFGVTAGDVDADRAIVWSRTDRASRLVVEYATTESFKDVRRVVGPAALEVSDFTARIDFVRAAAGSAHLLPGDVSEPARPEGVERADGRHVHDAAGDRATARCHGRLDGGHGWPRLGDRRRRGRHAALRDDAHGGRRCVHPHWRHHLRRCAARGRGQARRRPHVAQPRDAGEEQSRRDARRVPRQSPLQPARRERPALQRVAVAVRASGTTTRCSTTGIRPRCSTGDRPYTRAQRGAAGGAGEACLPGVHADAAGSRRSGTHLPGVSLRPAGRDLRVRHAQLSRAQHRQPPDGARATSRSSWAARRSSG